MHDLRPAGDERRCPRCLQSLVPWNEPGYEVVGEAAYGEAALMLLDTLRSADDHRYCHAAAQRDGTDPDSEEEIS